ncbi:GumC family protein [Sphingomonas yabuuchiae]|jgi:succinoglycan biosynthesis transport protein ExoP|uniref:Capsular exopolysaccharide synthesis family protein n=1 Tax=Sphingomonas yabuuchiae TaxID=172044 RepID=A0AA40ZVU7_9SPHN|nr:polysaccharide biosynthesis tyrosine autokinase [Sphingomonas yabuuchiae]MBB4611414.1 capsular exopolysaccharide synthesis family protein [Sphingomonas yabuuchiae]MBN3557000.1 polysaccharide biosynthesis tyrosine autokinase [Sphingomonas yabuuchiae]
MNMIVSQPHGAAAFAETNVRDSGSAQPADTMSFIRQYLRVARRWRYVIIGVTAGCVLLGLIVTLLMTPQYTATTSIEISREADQVTNFQGVERETGTADQEFYQTQYGLLESRALSERVATQLRLVDNPGFFERFGVTSDEGAFQLVNGRYAAAGRAERLRTAGNILRKNLAIVPTRFSRLVEIRFTSPDPSFSAQIANAWAENFIQTNLERKVQATSYGRNLLQRQLTQFKERLDASQRQLVAYASAQQIINLPQSSTSNGPTSERSIVADDLAALNGSLSQATAERIQAEARYQQAGRAGASPEALRNQAINTLRQRRAELAADYQRLMVQFEPGYPAAQAIQSQIKQLDRSIAREESRVSGSIQTDYREAVDREKALQAKVNQLKASYLDLRRRSIQYNIYQQEVDTNRVLYDGLLQRFKEIGVAGGVGVNNISIVDPADVPQSPSSPRLLLNVIISLLAGLGLGAGLAFALEQIDEAIADPIEVERRLGLPLLGSVPKVEGETPKQALLNRKSDLVDAYLAVQTNLAFTTEHGVPRSFAVTSTRPAEGKSTTALALATTLARANRRVILVDGDMRSPSVHHLGDVDHNRGLSNFLTGEDQIGTLTFDMQELGFTAMSAGPIPPNAAELLTGDRLALLIQRLLETYDHVVIDSPPVMGLADAPLIAARVEGVIYAVESHGIRSSMVKTALGRLRSANARVIGGVLTKFEARKAHYGYGYEYGYGYGRSDGDAAKSA